MLQLIYISSARKPLAQSELEALLATARRNNRFVGVTGLLLAGGQRFLQALEGPEKSVSYIFNKIAADDRHSGLVELGRKQVAQREFGSWEMAFEPAAAAAPGQGLRDEVEALVASLADRNLRAQFTGFAAIHGRAA